jgi:hypothetical protein
MLGRAQDPAVLIQGLIPLAGRLQGQKAQGNAEERLQVKEPVLLAPVACCRVSAG